MTCAPVGDGKSAESVVEPEKNTSVFLTPCLLTAFIALPAMFLVQKLCRAVALTVRELVSIAELRALLIALIVNNSLIKKFYCAKC